MGSGYKTFTAGAVLTASDVQNYLQDQSVMVFGGTAARSSAIGTANFEEGMLTYLTDVDKLQVYTGATFADVYPPAASNQGLTLLNTTSFSGVSSVSLPAATFSATYDNYLVIINVDSSASSETLNVRMRTGGSDNSSANYAYGIYGTKGQSTTAALYASGNALKTSIVVPAISGTYTTSLSFNFLKPFDSSFNTNLFFESSYFDSIGNYEFHTGQGVLSVTTSYDAASFIIASGTITGVYSVYGYSK